MSTNSDVLNGVVVCILVLVAVAAVARFCLLGMAILGPSNEQKNAEEVKLDALDLNISEISSISPNEVEEVPCGALPPYEDVMEASDEEYVPSEASEEGCSEPVIWTRTPKPLRLRRATWEWESDNFDWNVNAC